MEMLKTILDSGMSDVVKRRWIKDTTGMCSICGKVATKNIIYQLEDATLVEKYCDKCFN